MSQAAETIVDLRINETLQTGAVRIPPLPFSRLVGTVSSSAYAVRLETAPTGPDKSGSKPRGESVYLFLDFTIKKIRLVNVRNADLRSLRNLFEDCPFDPTVVIRIMVPIDDQNPSIVELHRPRITTVRTPPILFYHKLRRGIQIASFWV